MYIYIWKNVFDSYMNCSKDTEDWSPQQHMSENFRSRNKGYIGNFITLV